MGKEVTNQELSEKLNTYFSMPAGKPAKILFDAMVNQINKLQAENARLDRVCERIDRHKIKWLEICRKHGLDKADHSCEKCITEHF